MSRKKKNSLSKKQNILKLYKKLKIKSFNFYLGKLIILSALFLLFISLWIPWFSLTYNDSSYGAFSSIVGISGIINILIIGISLFVLFSDILKYKLQLLFGKHIGDFSIYILSSTIVCILSINSIISIQGLQIFSSEIVFHSGIIFNTIGSFLFFAGSLLVGKKEKSVTDSLFINNSPNNSETTAQKTEKLTKLPF